MYLAARTLVFIWPLLVVSMGHAGASSQQQHPMMRIQRRRPLILSKAHTRNTPQKRRSANTAAGPPRLLQSLRGGGAAEAPIGAGSPYGGELLELAYEWCLGLGAPSALVAGVVVATLHENIHQGDLVVSPKDDSRTTQLCKKATHLLLLSAFALETISIFVTTVTATMLLSQDSSIELATSPMRHLWLNHEFEYLTSRITFLQGLLHWLAALALNHMFPTTPPANGKTPSSVSAFNNCVACSLFMVIVLMVSFYNDHMTFAYANYGSMLRRWARLLLDTYFLVERRRPLSFFLLPLLVSSIYWGCRALVLYESTTPDDDDDATKKQS